MRFPLFVKRYILILAIYQDIQNRPGLGSTYENMADYYQSMDSNPLVITSYELALNLFD